MRGGDAACPFCATALPTASRAVPASTTRLGRGALFAFAVSVTACGGSTDADTVTDSGAADTAAKADSGLAADTFGTDTGTVVAAYGGPPIDSGTSDTNRTDGNADTRADSNADTSVDDDGGAAPLYGLPPPDADL